MNEETAAPPIEGQNAPTESAPGQPPQAVTAADGQEQVGAQPTEATEPNEGKAATPKGVQKRLDEMRRQIGDTQRLNERLVSILERSLTTGKPPSVEAKPNEPPRREAFADVESYYQAQADFQVAKAFEKAEAKVRETQAKQEAEAREKAWSERLAKAAEKLEDFEDVVFTDALPVTDVMADAMKESEKGPDIAYWLGKHPAEARRIATLSAVAQAREIGKIEARLLEEPAKPKREPSKAPAPIEPVGKGKTSETDLAPDLPMSEWVRRREAQLKANRR